MIWVGKKLSNRHNILAFLIFGCYLNGNITKLAKPIDNFFLLKVMLNTITPLFFAVNRVLCYSTGNCI
jgi:hypothetical protein